MIAAELKELIVKNGFHPVPVSSAGENAGTLRFDGTLDEFWAAAKALSSKVIFLQIHQMDEDDFERPVSANDSYRSGRDEDDEDVIDLEEAEPSISKFRKHVGKDCAFILIAKGGFAEIDYLLTEPWWDEFQEEAGKAVDAYIERREVQDAEESAETKKKNDELLKQLWALIGDKEFCCLKTQRAMLAYALEKIPELEELEEFVLKPEIQTLHARIEARGLNRK